ncbi:MAG: hypothetical protein RLZZ595_827 [Bacteroidota bacterium]
MGLILRGFVRLAVANLTNPLNFSIFAAFEISVCNRVIKNTDN